MNCRKWKCAPFGSILLCLFMLTGCGEGNVPPASAVNAADAAPKSYEAVHSILEYNQTVMHDCGCTLEGRIYYISAVEPPPKNGRTAILRLDTETGETAELTGFSDSQRQRREAQLGAYEPVRLAAAPDGTLRVLAEWYDQSRDAYTMYLLGLDSEGRILQETLLEVEQVQAWLEQCLVCDREGYAYLIEQSGVTVFDPQCQPLGQISGKVHNLIPLSDGRVAGLEIALDESQWTVRPIHRDKLSLEAGIAVPAAADAGEAIHVGKFYPGGEDYDFLYATDLSLYGSKLGSERQAGTTTQILSWLNCDIEGAALLTVGPIQDGFVCASISQTSGAEAAVLRERDGTEGEVQTLTLACRSLPDQIGEMVLKFNRQNNGYRIEIQDYGTAEGAGLAAGVDQMTADMLAGKMPDLFVTENLDEQMLIDRGLLADLWPYIDGDPQLGRDALVTPFFDALSQDGKLYTVSDSFFIWTALGLTEHVGDKQGWTVAEFREKLAEMERDHQLATPCYSSQEGALEDVISYCAEGFINRADWTASFDSPEFVELLEYAGCFPKKGTPLPDTPSWVQTEQALFTTAYNIWNISFLNFAPIEKCGTSEATFVGYPGVKGNGSVFGVSAPVAMWSGCEHPEGAWMFLRMLLLPENQKYSYPWSPDLYFGIPTSKSAYDAMMKGLLSPAPHFQHQASTPDGQRVTIPYWTEADTERAWEFLSGITVVEGCDQSIAAIIRDEAARYFAGEQTAQAAAKAIQSRVNLYLGERKQ